MKKKPPIKQPEDELRPPPSDFSTAITRIAVAQICQSVGFKAAQRSALETLTDVATRYLRSLAKSAAASASSTGRTQSNLFDVVCSLEELHSVVGFRGASNVAQSLYSSSTVADTMKFVNYSCEIPFAKPVPRRKFASGLPTVGGAGGGFEFVNGRGNHIPKWLPAIPEMRKKEEGNGEERWGVIVGSSSGQEVCLGGEKKMAKRNGKKRTELGLPRKRERVSFKFGKGKGKGMNEGGIKGMELVRSGICRGGKRILCQTMRTGDEEEGANKENKLQEMTEMELD